MRRSTLVTSALAAVVVLATTAAGCETTENVQDRCLRASTVTTVRGERTTAIAFGAFPAGGTVDARGATARLDISYPLYLKDVSGPDVCVVGGSVGHTAPHATTSWDEWHSNGAGALTKSAGSTFVGTEVHNVGDGFNLAGGSQGWLLQGVRASQVHDDCVQNDYFHSGKIDDSLFDGCYAFLSARKSSATTSWLAFDEKVVITRSLVHVAAMPDTYVAGFGPPGHGSVWKMGSGAAGSGISPRIGIHDTIIRIDGDAAGGDRINLPSVDHDQNPATPPRSYLDEDDCSNNTIVWIGTGPMPHADTYPSSCFTITTDLSVWDDAVRDWEASRP